MRYIYFLRFTIANSIRCMHTLYISSRMAATLQLDLVYIRRFALLVGYFPYLVFKEGMSANVKLSKSKLRWNRTHQHMSKKLPSFIFCHTDVLINDYFFV